MPITNGGDVSPPSSMNNPHLHLFRNSSVFTQVTEAQAIEIPIVQDKPEYVHMEVLTPAEPPKE